MYSFDSVVRYSEVDERGRLGIAALLNYLQDCSSFQSESLGVGVAHSAQVHRRWLLAAWEVEIARLPRFADPIVVSTWATGFRGLFAGRNFTVRDAAGEELVRADSLWFMYDDATGKPMRTPAEEITPYQHDLDNDERLPMPPIQRRIPVEGPGEAATPVVVSAAHIDTNHHVNNAQYVSLALGVLPEGAGEAVRRLDVQYCAAARLGDTIYPRVHDVEGGHVVSLADAGGAPYAVVRVRGCAGAE